MERIQMDGMIILSGAMAVASIVSQSVIRPDGVICHQVFHCQGEHTRKK